MKYGWTAKQIGAKIRAYRYIQEAGNRTILGHLCKKAGMTETNWKERERGKMDMRLSTLFKMLAALRVTPKEFFGSLGSK